HKKARCPGERATGRSGAGLRLGRSGRLLLLAPLARELLDLARGVDQALLAREERVAVRADLEAQLLALGGPRGPGRAAGAMDVDVDVFGMDPRLHDAPRGGRAPAVCRLRRRAAAVTVNSSSLGRPLQCLRHGAGHGGRSRAARGPPPPGSARVRTP